jgi:hypothetical protein
MLEELERGNYITGANSSIVVREKARSLGAVALVLCSPVVLLNKSTLLCGEGY